MGEAQTNALNVCVCGAAGNCVTLLLHSLAAGHVLGNSQYLHLTLEDSTEKAYELQEQALDLNDACHLLVMSMKTKTDRCESLHGSDLILLILDTTGMEDMAAIIASYAAAFNSTVRAKQKIKGLLLQSPARILEVTVMAVVIVGENALAAAGLLCILSPQLSQHLVTAVEVTGTSHEYTHTSGGFMMTNAVCEHVLPWWSALQMPDTLEQMADTSKTGADVHDFIVSTFHFLPGPFLSSQKRVGSKSVLSHETEQACNDLKSVLKHLQISDAQVLSSIASSQL